MVTHVRVSARIERTGGPKTDALLFRVTDTPASFVRRFLPLTVLTMLVVLLGCGPQRAQDVDVQLARQTLQTTLETWQAGKSIESLRSIQPEIVAQESAWSNGMVLLAFDVVDQGRAEDANYFCEVDLNLQDPRSGKISQRRVTYVVGTDPVLTVFHAIL